MPIDSYTKLLIHFDGSDADTADQTAATGQTVSLEGNACLDTAYKKFGSASLLLDGTGDYATVPDSADWYLGADPFTIDAWVKVNATGKTESICGQWDDVNNYWSVHLSENGTSHYVWFKVRVGGVEKANYHTGLNALYGAWHHIEVVRTGTSVYIFIDGVSQSLTETTAISTNEVPNLTSVLYIGAGYGVSAAANPLHGAFDEFRISKGIARHTAGFTPPSSAYPIDNGFWIMFD